MEKKNVEKIATPAVKTATPATDATTPAVKTATPAVKTATPAVKTATPATDATLSRVPVVAEKDTTPAPVRVDAAPMVTTETGAPVVAATPAAKTKEQITRERRNAAKNAAADAYKSIYNGNPAAALMSRALFETDTGNVSAYDFTYDYTDADGKPCNGRGVIRVTALMSADAAKTVRDNYAAIAARVVSFHNARNAGTGADAEKERAAEKAAIMPLFNAIMHAYGVTADIKTRDVAAVIETAYFSNAAGDDDAKKSALVSALENVAARMMRKQERRDNYARRVKKAADKKAAAAAERKAKKAAAAGTPAKKNAKK